MKGVVVEVIGFNDGSLIRFVLLINGCWILVGGYGWIVESEIFEVMEMYVWSGLMSFDIVDIYGFSESIFGVFCE